MNAGLEMTRTGMEISQEMLDAAIRKAVELGLLPRCSQMEDVATNAELMREILEAALTQPPPSEQG